MKQMDRRLLILTRLREQRPTRASDLAEACDCSVRTIYRDIDALCAAGVPVAALPGEGYRLAPGYHLPPIAFTPEEAQLLLLGSDLAHGVGSAAQREAARSAAAKVEGALPPETLRDVDRRRRRVVVEPHRREPSAWLGVALEGVLSERVVRLRYYAFASEQWTEREVEPYLLVFYGDDWHLQGHCRLRNDVRDFRLSRVERAELTAERFTRPASVADMSCPDESPPMEVRVWLDASVAPWARETPMFGLRGEEAAEGGTVFVFDCWEPRRLLPWILGWGASARVLSPGEFVERVRAEAEALGRLYRE
jgi:predicted DNA-binding transcriptional regulator YafY